ncbi:hypothetical protein ACOSP7_027437 [Xanthoceras sorbifolium]
MLAKQCSRLICSPNTLAARVLKSVYFPHCSFLDASTGSSPLLVWQSILWGRQLVELGSRCRIGNGMDTFVYKDRWLPRPSTFKVLSPISLDPLLKVIALKTPSGGWNSNLVWSAFLPDDVSLILNLHYSSEWLLDSLQK